jgi:hypothetical protein
MNRWARYLQEAPATLQRLIARHNRISLPRGCSAEERVQRLRDALIHQRTVRVTWKNGQCRMDNAECRVTLLVG